MGAVLSLIYYCLQAGLFSTELTNECSTKVNDLQRRKRCIKLNNATVSQLRGIDTWIRSHRTIAIGPITKPWTVLISPNLMSV